MMARRPAINLPPEPAPVAAPVSVPASPARRPAARQGKIQVAFFLDRDAKRQLDLLALDEGKRLQRLMLEALDLLFQSRGKGRIAVQGAVATAREAAE